MRKALWIITSLAVATALVFSVISLLRVDWLVVKNPEHSHTKITTFYGLTKTCELDDASLPGPSGSGYTIYQCRKFPASVSDGCETASGYFCSAWVTAGYAAELSASFSFLSLLSVLFGISTRARRRRMWRAVVGLVSLQAIFQVTAFAIITDAHRRSLHPGFKDARLGVAYVLGILAWVIGVLTVLGVGGTGISAEKGHVWAAGNRAYRQMGAS